MSKKVKFTIDGNEISAEEGKNLLDVACENGYYIPALCHMKGHKPAGSCRLCNVKVNGRIMTACTTLVSEGMEVITEDEELAELRKTILEAMFVDGNHFCPACEKSGVCDLQALAYKHKIMSPKFKYEFSNKKVEAEVPKIMLEKNRCILCKKCIRAIKSKDGKNIFGFKARGKKLEITMDEELAAQMTDEDIQRAMDICPVGTIIKKEKGFKIPIGKRKYDKKPIGDNVEKHKEKEKD
ncbi:2Fe-2S iron-sulfur cluster binding domain-containing protein [Candidatus Dojkabacteria bacterium]|nr:2Fe-2S iron-sulfur cluster binding domain-containing protein [Candidatus Dojkabacteria bacterium]